MFIHRHKIKIISIPEPPPVTPPPVTPPPVIPPAAPQPASPKEPAPPQAEAIATSEVSCPVPAVSIQVLDPSVNPTQKSNSPQEALPTIAALMNSGGGSVTIALSDNAAIDDIEKKCCRHLLNQDSL